MSDKSFNEIIIDRATSHALLVHDPFSMEDICAVSDTSQRQQYFKHASTKFFLSNNDICAGMLQKSIFCLLLIHIITTIKEHGSLIIDAAYLNKEHLTILMQFFERSSTWNFNTRDKQCLKYSDAYDSGRYWAPNFLVLQGRNTIQPNFSLIKSNLSDACFNPSKVNVHPVNYSFLITVAAFTISATAVVIGILILASLITPPVAPVITGTALTVSGCMSLGLLCFKPNVPTLISSRLLSNATAPQPPSC